MRWRAPVRYLPNNLLQPRRALIALVVAWLTAFPFSLVLSLAARTVMPEAEAPAFEAEGAFTLFMLTIFAPVVETLIMGAVILLLLRFVSPTIAVIVSALGWGLAHSSLVPIWGLVIWWPFLIFSILFVAWRQRSLLLAFVMPALAHLLQNALPGVLIAYGLDV